MPFLVQRHVGQDVDRHLFAARVDGHGVVDGLRQRRVRIERAAHAAADGDIRPAMCGYCG